MPSFLPHPMLRRRVAGIDVLENDGGNVLVLPSTSAVLGFQFRGRVHAGEERLAPVGITGIQSVAKTYSYANDTGSVLVRFTAEGAACLGVPSSELASRSIALDAFLPRARIAETRERLSEARDARARVAIVERFLMELPYAGDHVVSHVVTLLESSTGDASVAAIARALGMSERQLERRFLARVGVAPKRFAALRRFERAVALSSETASLTAVALGAGYYDQSHFIRDFRRFVGMAPGEFFARR